jgi:hypothetical protein
VKAFGNPEAVFVTNTKVPIKMTRDKDLVSSHGAMVGAIKAIS